MVRLAEEQGIDIAFLANQFAIQRTKAATTVVGAGKPQHLRSALNAAETPIDEGILTEILALRPQPEERQWTSGLAENN